MGVGHRSIEVGDNVYVLMGADMPVIVRQVGSNYVTFGGETYVHGVMDGEILKLARARKEGAASPMKTEADDSWLEDLGDQPWPFDTSKIVLV